MQRLRGLQQTTVPLMITKSNIPWMFRWIPTENVHAKWSAACS